MCGAPWAGEGDGVCPSVAGLGFAELEDAGVAQVLEAVAVALRDDLAAFGPGDGGTRAAPNGTLQAG